MFTRRFRFTWAAAICVVLLVGCGGSPSTSPSPQPLPTPVAVPNPSPAPAPSPGPAPPPTINFGPSFTVTGVVRDGLDGSPLPDVTVTFGALGQCGKPLSDVVTGMTDAQGRYSITNHGGWLEFTRAGFFDLCGYLILFGDRTVHVTLPRAGCSTYVTDLIQNPLVTKTPDYIEFAWNQVQGARDYLVEVGTENGPLNYHSGPNSDRFLTPNVMQTFTGGAARYRWNTPSVAPGEYWVRVSAKSDCGMGPLGNSAGFRVP
jgi:hypothetical protein